MRAAVGVAGHNGWAYLVTMGLEHGEPGLLDRRRVALVADDLPSQPYHHEALELPLAEATTLVARVRASAEAYARLAFEALRADLAPSHDLVAAAIKPSVFGRVPDLVEVLAYRPMIYAADGMLYAEVTEDAARQAGLSVLTYAKEEELTLAAAALGCDPPEAEAMLKAIGKAAGPPWTKEHLLAAAAALGALRL